jgi:2-dehydro-3-deoxygalactonokinase
MIGIDWGTSNFRAFLLDPAGTITARRTAPSGVVHVADRTFAAVLRAAIADWLGLGEHRVLLCGAIGSREGWQDVPYLPCPAGLEDLAAAVAPVPFAGADIRLVPGIIGLGSDGVPDTMRGEETQVMGIAATLPAAALVCLPGTHSKWVQVENGRIVRLASHMTGEVFAALHEHTLLGRTMHAAPPDPAAFDRGLARAGEAGGLLHHLFGVRALGLTGRLDAAESFAYLSGLLIGHEIRAAPVAAATVHLVGDPTLCGLYARAIAACGGTACIGDADAAPHGLAAIGRVVDWRRRDGAAGCCIAAPDAACRGKEEDPVTMRPHLVPG